MSRLQSGQRHANRFELIAPIRSGGRAQVWQALDHDGDRLVALKFDDNPERLAHEADWLRSMAHPAYIGVLALHADQPRPFIALEAVEGHELRDYIGAPRQRWLPLLRMVIDALHHAHGRGLAHGDLSLHNILVGDDGRVRLLDPAAGEAVVADDMRALGEMVHELATGLVPGDDGAALADRDLARLVSDLLGNNLQLSLSEVATKMDRMLTERGTQSDHFERIEPIGRDAVATSDDHAAPTGLSWRWILLGVAAVATLALAFVLPGWLDPGTATGGGSAVERQSAAAVRLQQQQQEVKRLRGVVYENWLALNSMDVSRWAEQRAARAQALLQEGERLAGEFELVAAIRELTAADQLLTQLRNEAPGIAAFHRDAGFQAFAAADGDGATEHFRIALAIEPEDEAVREAMRRAQFLNQTAEIRAAATRLRTAGDYEGAIARLQEVLLIDPEDAIVSNEISDLEDMVAERDFNAAMSAAFTALDQGRYAAARTALNRAAELRPDSAAVRDARTQVRVASHQASIRRLRASARAAEQAQQWEEAIALYTELLQLDPALVFAQQGRDRARLLASLTVRSQNLLEDGDFTTDESRRQANTLVRQISDVQTPAPRLRQLSADLQAMLARANEPVTVVLQSDRQTEVTIYRVGPLGRFEQQQIELLPGRYTVTGRCDGFRDVRHELVVQPGSRPSPLTIRCEERI
ncbi:MAG: hypothetical protein HKN49_12010 [Gammaproteobacteria bacterium]|nr:hypothetical protein [Gammaproteobacteria bacterium]